MLFRFALLLSSLFASCVQGNDVKCEKKSSCSCDMNNGMGRIDLSSLASKDKNNPRFNADNNRYTYNPCFSFNQGDCTAENEVAVCQLDDGGLSCGTQTNMTFQYDPGTGIVSVIYKGGDGDRLSHIELHCSENSTVFDFVEENPSYHYNFKLYDKNCCFVSTSNSISAGSILVIIFFCLLVTYFGAGVLYMKLRSGARGKEMIPNHSFWLGLPGMVKNGILFVFTCGRKKETYDPLP
ncbi:cation-dependent mannose-6-phosphate receptor-like [Oscarella lobularis]|uniref:cation-dependent mannose-6-phosphate receptor-like n=1 Tax=Oscarella lobularis TaxID=121494 RepID=UPI0033140C1D